MLQDVTSMSSEILGLSIPPEVQPKIAQGSPTGVLRHKTVMSLPTWWVYILILFGIGLLDRCGRRLPLDLGIHFVRPTILKKVPVIRFPVKPIPEKIQFRRLVHLFRCRIALTWFRQWSYVILPQSYKMGRYMMVESLMSRETISTFLNCLPKILENG